MSEHVVIIGAGPAGLTAGTELVSRGRSVTILEQDPAYVGGISRTVGYKGFRFDIGGHRFFSKSQEITAWWRVRLPNDFITVRRTTRILYRGRFFNYPLRVFNAVKGLGLWLSFLCGVSLAWSRLHPIKPETTFRAWVSNRFGRRLFGIFFESYTEKVWGMTCDEISADWAAQRIRGLSLMRAVLDALRPRFLTPRRVIKSLIEMFEYPRLGPGQMWEKARNDIQAAGGRVHMGEKVVRISHDKHRIVCVTTKSLNGQETEWQGDSFISSMPMRELVAAFDPPLAEEIRQAAGSLRYRDFLTVALMIRKPDLFPDNWIYVHSPEVNVGRIQNFGNWSRELLPTPDVSCLGMEYFCFEGDAMWTARDEDLIAMATREIAQLKLAKAEDVFDGSVVRMPKAYPIYDATSGEAVRVLREALGGFANLQLIGRNGQHRYNNQDHSMMTGLLAARNLLGGHADVWHVNTDAEYHEESAA